MSFKRLDPQDFITSADSVISPAWSGNTGSLNTFFTQSVQATGASGNYYLDVYDKDPQSNTSAEVQFGIAYANKNGLGALKYNTNISASYSSTIYGQMRNLLLEDENENFMFYNITASDFYVINVNRARYKEKLMPGSWTLNVNGTSYTDDSKARTIPQYIGSQRVYNVGVGVLGGASMTSTYGLFFPDTSIILLAASLATPDVTSNFAAHNERKLYNAINTNPKLFTLQSEETITSNYIFVRARNSEFNYSENPSYISGSTGEVLHNSFIYNPQTYVTSVGFYNDSNELLAVAKLSKPLLKDATKEILLRTKIDF